MKNEFKFQFKDWSNVSPKSMEFILEQGQKTHEACLEIADRISQRAIWSVGLFIPLAIAIISYQGVSSHLLSVVLVALLLCFVSLIYILLPRKEMLPGADPKTVPVADFLENESLTEGQSYLALLISQVEDVQNGIDYTVHQNKVRLRALRITILVIAVSYLSSGIFLLLTSCQS